MDSRKGRNVRKLHKLYVDPDGVRRGYYVYLHKDPATGAVFYVGKGTGRRAWDETSRNAHWNETVASLRNGWEVDIVNQDLSEIEALELETELVKKYGGSKADGGPLTNWVPGGEDPASVGLTFEFDDGGWSVAYRDARKFQTFSRREEERFARDLKKDLDFILRKLADLEQEAEGNEKLLDIVSGLSCIVGRVAEVSSDFLRRRVSWKDFALALEDTVDDLQSEMKETVKYHKKLKPLLKEAIETMANTLSEIDSGNRKEAEDAANSVKSRK